MQLDVSHDGDVTIAAVSGDVDFAVADEFARDLMAAIPTAAVGLVIDLSAARYVDSGGVRTFFEVAAHLAASERKLALAVPETSPLRRLIKITRLEEVALLCAATDECVEMIRTA